MKIEFTSDYESPLNKTLEITSMIIIFKAVFHEKRNYTQVFLDKCLYKL